MKEEIEDTEIRVIGSDRKETASSKPNYRWLIVAGVVVVLLALLIGGLVLLRRNAPQEAMPEQVFEPTVQAMQPHPLAGWLSEIDSIAKPCTVTKDITVNDIPLTLFVPMNATPRLEVGYKCIEDRENNILVFQAADIRADNKKIVGAFVLRGQPLSWGLSKRGYCAILDGEITVGVADNTPLFEEATEREGYFFRQYPLVDQGVLVENELKSKSIRRALCSIEGKIVVVESLTKESLHDFAQALVDLGADNAVYMTGSTSIGWCRDAEGNGIKRGLWDNRTMKNVNFIVWSK